MLTRTKFRIAAVVGAAAMAIGAFGAAPASAQAPGVNVAANNLVNVQLSDVIDVNGNNVSVQVPIGVAANVCGVDVDAAILAQDLRDGTQNTQCTATNDQLVRAFQAH